MVYSLLLSVYGIFLHIHCKLSLRGDEGEFRGTAAEVKRREKDVQERISWENECI